MADVVWTILALGAIAGADAGWTRYRRWRVRRRALKHGRTLTAKFALDHD